LLATLDSSSAYVLILVAPQTKAALEDTLKNAQDKLDAIERDVKAREAATTAKLASLHAVRQACGERGIVVGYPLFRDMRRSACDPYINEVLVLLRRCAVSTGCGSFGRVGIGCFFADELCCVASAVLVP
jgi:hypothetical protein